MLSTLSRARILPAGAHNGHSIPAIEDGAAPPQNIDAERSVLAAMMLGNEAVGTAIEMIDGTAFYRTAHRKIFDAIVALHHRGERADSITVSAELRRRGDFEVVGGAATLNQVLDYATTTANLREHCTLVREAASKRRLRDLGFVLVQRAGDPSQSAETVLRHVEAEASALSAAAIRVSAGTPLGRGSGGNYLGLVTARALVESVPAETPWLVRPWVARGAIAEVTGKVKAGKTTLLAAMVRAVLEGRPFLGGPVERTPVLWLTEQTPATFREVLRRSGLDGRDDLHVMPWLGTREVPWPDVAALAVARAHELGIGLLIVDTLSQFAGLQGDGENNARDALGAMRPLQVAAAQDLAVIATRHERKGGGDVGDAGRGSSAFAGAVDVMLALRRPEGASRPTLRVLHALSRFDETPAELMVEWSGDTYIAIGDTRDVALREAKAGLFREAPEGERCALTLDDLLARVPGVKRTVAQEAIKVLLAAGVLRSAGAGRKGDPRRYYRPMDSAETTAGHGRNDPEPGGEW